MRAWRKFFTLVIVLVAAVFIAANWLLHYLNIPENGRPHRVEINRLALQIELNGFKNVDLSECEFVYNISEFGADFYDTAGDYLIREINGELYRFDYRKKNSPVNAQAAITVNVILAVMTAVVFGILLFVRGKIIRPFERLTNVPYELSKGNLTPPVKENKSRFFGKFLWGLDLLRENIEQQKQRELELQKEKKTLLLSLSHDIKTPLSAIKLYSKALSKDLYPDKEKQRGIAESINEKADEIERYVTQIITASREDFLSLDLENGEFYLSELVQNIADYYIEKLKLVKTELVIGKYKNYLLFGDLNRAEEVLQNVIENALKYGNGKRVDLLFPDNDEGVLITVRNSGCTLNNYELPHIFESFWRGANSENIRGSGLGLYICRKLMHKMNGEIFAEINGEFISVTAVFSRA
ncbi:MAG: HAMP domain-containing sensor histidine kinase [Oscillospiraceae bacterium]|nr:HAMP domain-containing sensor histidine kinase [Oscillospiraceae bacterium]